MQITVLYPLYSIPYRVLLYCRLSFNFSVFPFIYIGRMAVCHWSSAMINHTVPAWLGRSRDCSVALRPLQRLLPYWYYYSCCHSPIGLPEFTFSFFSLPFPILLLPSSCRLSLSLSLSLLLLLIPLLSSSLFILPPSFTRPLPLLLVLWFIRHGLRKWELCLPYR